MHIAHFLEKFKNVGFKEFLFKEVVVEIVKKECNVPLSKEDVVLKNGTLFIKTSPAARNLIFIKKDRLIGLLKPQLPYLKDIR